MRNFTSRTPAGRGYSLLIAVFALCAALILPDPAFSGSDCPGGKGRMAKRVEAVSEKLDLDEDQRAKLEAMMTEARKERKAMWREFRQSVRSLMKDKKKEFSALLTEDQRNKMESEKLNPFKKRRGHHHGKRHRDGKKSHS